MGIGPVYAIPMALKLCGLTQDDVDLYEVGVSSDRWTMEANGEQINEAFASQCVYVMRALGLPQWVLTSTLTLEMDVDYSF